MYLHWQAPILSNFNSLRKSTAYYFHIEGRLYLVSWDKAWSQTIVKIILSSVLVEERGDVQHSIVFPEDYEDFDVD